MRRSGFLIIARAFRLYVLNPMPLLSGLGMSLFFLIIYDAGLGGIGRLPEFGGAGYLAFLLPMGVVSLIFGSSSGSAQALSRDISSRYFQRLALAPVPRSSFVLAAIIADAVGIFLSALGVIGVGIIMGIRIDGTFWTIALKMLSVAALAGFFGSGVSALSAAIVMRTGKAQLSGAIGTAVFMLLFLAPTFAPRELMGAAWLRTVSYGNPLSYLMDAMRYLISGTGSAACLTVACALALAFGIGGSLLAAFSVRKVLN